MIFEERLFKAGELLFIKHLGTIADQWPVFSDKDDNVFCDDDFYTLFPQWDMVAVGECIVVKMTNDIEFYKRDAKMPDAGVFANGRLDEGPFFEIVERVDVKPLTVIQTLLLQKAAA